MTDRELLEMALEALDNAVDHLPKPNSTNCANITAALRARLAEPEEKYTYGTPLLDEFIGKQPDLAKVGEVGVWSSDSDTSQERVDETQEQRHEPVWDTSSPIVMKPHPAFVKREWQGLTGDDINEIHSEIKVKGMGSYKIEDIYRAIEAKLKEKNS